MRATFKVLRQALVVVLAIGGVGSSSAGASTGGHFVSDAPSGVTVIDGHQVGGTADNFLQDTQSELNIACPDNQVTYHATIATATATEASATATYPTEGGKCQVVGGFGGTADIHMNGCSFKLTAESSGAHTKAHLVCPAGKEITVTADPTILGTCVIHVPSQTPTGGGVIFTPTTDNGKASFKIDVTATGVTNNKTPSGFLGCAGLSGENNASNLTGTVTVTANDSESDNPVNVESTGPDPVAFSEVEHSLLTGSDVANNGFKFGEVFGSVVCDQTTYVGTLETAQSNSITVEPTYSGCKGLGRTVTTHMHGCGFVLKLTGEGEDGQVEIECPGEKPIETTYDMFEGGCTITIGPQTAGGVVDYKEEGTGPSRDLLVTWTLKEIDYVRDGCELEGAATNGTYSGSVTIEAENTSEEASGLWIE